LFCLDPLSECENSCRRIGELSQGAGDNDTRNPAPQNASQGAAASRLEILVGLLGKVIEPASCDILLDSLVPLIGNILVEPCGKLGELLRGELLNRQF
jgi:hypothetical protein